MRNNIEASIGSVTNDPFTFITNNTERMRLDASGNLGLGVTPSASWDSGFKALQIGAQGQGIAVSTAVSQVWLSSNGVFNGTNWLYFNSASAGQYQIDGNAHKWFTAPSGTSGNAISFTQAMTLDASGNLFCQGIYNNTSGSAANVFVASNGLLQRSTSSLKYKTDIQDATHGLADVMRLRPVTYKGKNDGDKVFSGLIAEEVHSAGLTEFVQYADDGSPDALAYGNMVALLIKAIQEQQAVINELRARVAALEAG